ncbi:MAG: M15 family metallopeptidase [Pseudonocardiaceae bacterium]
MVGGRDEIAGTHPPATPSEIGEFTTATPAHAKVTDTVRRRRRLLTRCLTEVGFINYPAEWWHFSMGDRLWAAYGRRPEARFGPLTVGEPPET